MQSNKRVCVIGAGPSGLSAGKNCIEAGLDVVIFEKNDKVGGNWVFNSKTGHSNVYENTHIISSKVWSEFEDFPIPEDYPDYPKHNCEYFKTFLADEPQQFDHAHHGKPCKFVLRDPQ